MNGAAAIRVAGFRRTDGADDAKKECRLLRRDIEGRCR
jgi:hypothetical protein